MPWPPVLPNSFWSTVTRLGEAQILLPAALLCALWLARRPEGRIAAYRWMALLGGAALLTTASKVAFIGFGLGVAAWDFTGVSGHTMFATAVLPALFGCLPPPGVAAARRAAVVAGLVLALLIGVSRLVVHAHSGSEIAAGWLLGGAVGALVLSRPPPTLDRAPLWLPLLLALWLLLTPATAPPSQTHDWVTRLSLAVAGTQQPYTREQMQRDRQDRTGSANSAPTGVVRRTVLY